MLDSVDEKGMQGCRAVIMVMGKLDERKTRRGKS